MLARALQGLISTLVLEDYLIYILSHLDVIPQIVTPSSMPSNSHTLEVFDF